MNFAQVSAWNVELLEEWLPRYMVDLVLELALHREDKDTLIWNASSSGCFSTHSSYDMVRKKTNSSLVLRSIWNSLLLLKIYFLAWRVLNNYLPLDANLEKLGVFLVSKCYCCASTEISRHLFFESKMA